MFKLTPRLEKVCAYVGECKTLADIGTDHAFVPLTLIGRGKCDRAYACDVGKGPLSRAEEYIRSCGMTDKVKTFLSDGFDSVPDDWDTAVIAGMGGELTANILSRINTANKRRFVFQPMTKIPELRRFLYTSGYSITDEDIVREGEKLYIVIKAENSPCDWNESLVYASTALRAKTYSEKYEYFEALAERLESIARQTEFTSAGVWKKTQTELAYIKEILK